MGYGTLHIYRMCETVEREEMVNSHLFDQLSFFCRGTLAIFVCLLEFHLKFSFLRLQHCKVNHTDVIHN